MSCGRFVVQDGEAVRSLGRFTDPTVRAADHGDVVMGSFGSGRDGFAS